VEGQELKTTEEDLIQVLHVAVSVANFIKKQHPLKSHIFAKLCESMENIHVTLFQHTHKFLLQLEMNILSFQQKQ
jgi:hypothetical protein